MRNLYLRERIASQIDLQVEKLLRDLGNPEPPLHLDQVRDLLRLDLKYYSSADDGLITEVFHRARLGGHLIATKAVGFLEAIKRWDIKAAFFPEQNRIVIDRSVPEPKWRWSEGHEIVHSLIPWHRSLMFADSSKTLSPECSYKMESEANYGAGRLLFLRGQFLEDVRSSKPSWDHLKSLSKRYANTLTSTLWRAVESLEEPAFGIVGFHPHHAMKGSDEGHPCRYFIRSPRFISEFSGFDEKQGVAIFESYCRRNMGGPLGSKVAIITDDNGEEHEFLFESFSNTHECLTIATHQRKRVAIVQLSPT